MFEIMESYFKDKKYYIIICDDKVYIKNYTKLYELSNNYILVEVDKIIYKITGKSFSLVKNYHMELEINGIVESMEKV